MRNRTNKLNSNKIHIQLTHTCIITIINQNFNHSSMHSINPSFDQTIMFFLTVADAVDAVDAAAVDMEYASVSIVGRTNCAITMEESAATLHKGISRMQHWRITWAEICTISIHEGIG